MYKMVIAFKQSTSAKARPTTDFKVVDVNSIEQGEQIFRFVQEFDKTLGTQRHPLWRRYVGANGSVKEMDCV